MPTTCDAPPPPHAGGGGGARRRRPHPRTAGREREGRKVDGVSRSHKKRRRKNTHRDRERKRSRQRVVVNVVVVVETNANVLSRKETKKRGTANPNDQSRTTTTTTTTKDIYPTALSRPYFFLDTINIVSVYPQLIYTSYPIANQSRSTTQPRANTPHSAAQKKKKRHIHHARVVMSRLVFSSPR